MAVFAISAPMQLGILLKSFALAGGGDNRYDDSDVDGWPARRRSKQVRERYLPLLVVRNRTSTNMRR